LPSSAWAGAAKVIVAAAMQVIIVLMFMYPSQQPQGARSRNGRIPDGKTAFLDGFLT
jgi:hypothetical protein